MGPLAIVQMVAAIVSVAYASEKRPDGHKQVRILGIPVYDTEWPGVKRRQARRAKRRARREAVDKEPAVYLDDKFGGRK